MVEQKQRSQQIRPTFRIGKIVPSIAIGFTRHLGGLATKSGNELPHQRVSQPTTYVCVTSNVCRIFVSPKRNDRVMYTLARGTKKRTDSEATLQS